eukprot:6982903-Prymnesium_polylepis.3
MRRPRVHYPRVRLLGLPGRRGSRGHGPCSGLCEHDGPGQGVDVRWGVDARLQIAICDPSSTRGSGISLVGDEGRDACLLFCADPMPSTCRGGAGSERILWGSESLKTASRCTAAPVRGMCGIPGKRCVAVTHVTNKEARDG